MEPLLHLPLDLDDPHHITIDGPRRPWEREREARAKRRRLITLLSVAGVLAVADTVLVLLA
jgi:hypothetical protein